MRLVIVQLVPAELPALVGALPARRGWAMQGSLGRLGLGNLDWVDFLLANSLPLLPVLDDKAGLAWMLLVVGVLLLLLLAVTMGEVLVLPLALAVATSRALLSLAAFWAVNSRTISAVNAFVLGRALEAS